MSEPGHGPLAAPQGQERLWDQAPAWRNLTIAATLLTAAAAALPLALPEQPDQLGLARPALARSVPVCAIALGSEAQPMGAGVVTGFEDIVSAQQRMLSNEKALGGPISPGFANTPRAIVRMDGNGSGQIAVVPPGMIVHVGDHVAFNANHRDTGAACAYVPPLITADDGATHAVAAAPPPAAIRPAPASRRIATAPQSVLATPQGAQACQMRPAPTAPRPVGTGTIVGVEDPQQAQAAILTTETNNGGKIDPDYVSNERVWVQMGAGTRAFIVPKGMTVQIGDRVTLQGSYRNMVLACNYVPVQIASDIGPPPANNMTAPDQAAPAAETLSAPAAP